MFWSDACCFRNGQLKQFNDGEGWGKQKHFIQAKIHANHNENKKKTPENPSLILLYTIFDEKGPLSHAFYQ